MWTGGPPSANFDDASGLSARDISGREGARVESLGWPWSLRGGVTHSSAAYPVVRPGSVYAWLCTSATAEGLARGRACWNAGPIGDRPTPVNGCPQRILDRAALERCYPVRLTM